MFSSQNCIATMYYTIYLFTAPLCTQGPRTASVLRDLVFECHADRRLHHDLHPVFVSMRWFTDRFHFPPHSHIQMPCNRVYLACLLHHSTYHFTHTITTSRQMSLQLISFSFWFVTSNGFFLDGLEGDTPFAFGKPPPGPVLPGCVRLAFVVCPLVPNNQVRVSSSLPTGANSNPEIIALTLPGPVSIPTSNPDSGTPTTVSTSST
ncbi:uncharacterized protein EV420DRAFT_1572336 [Desarmillaria tabescens]|uniref:Uncharacterized protein n=1 Tax=Armillaria tabescens TaxID=1929756 RepID=A0AA39JNX1_ARMTA|nr:uncharacterized protein EV420DRAFT_1572336 [Desarmillaria tabescens]KAK0445305.1 hypothetical protein EV420DRAFT_1572336 [Desarmillaria tabescens]